VFSCLIFAVYSFGLRPGHSFVSLVSLASHLRVPKPYLGYAFVLLA